MKPDVVVDIGNSRVKFGLCIAGEVANSVSLPDDPDSWSRQLVSWKLNRPICWAVSSVHPERLSGLCGFATARGDKVLALDDYRLLPLKVEVDEPARVGIDRLLNAVAFKPQLPSGTAGAIIDVGTATTVDLLDNMHIFIGGAILPGPRLMFESLNRQTAKLPLIDLHAIPDASAPGMDTRSAIEAGVMAAQVGAAQYLVREYQDLCQSPLWVMVTGGAHGILSDFVFDGAGKNLANPTLTLEGIRIAAEFQS